MFYLNFGRIPPILDGKKTKLNKNNALALDLGVNNLVTAASSKDRSFIIDDSVKRGMYRTVNRKLLNTDVNGALNIKKNRVVSLDTLYSGGEVNTPVRIRAA